MHYIEHQIKRKHDLKKEKNKVKNLIVKQIHR